MPKFLIATLNKISLPLLLGIGLLSGCASVQQAAPAQDEAVKRFEAPAPLSRIYIYRNEFLGTLVGLDLTVNGQPAGTTKGKTFVVADVPAGAQEIVSKGENSSNLRISTRTGETAYVWQEVKMGLFSAGSKLHSVDAAVGRAGVLETNLVASPMMVARPALEQTSGVAAVDPVGAVTAGAVPLQSTEAAPNATRSRYEFEAERVAKDRGCSGPGGIRPAARLDSRNGTIESFSVQCLPGSLRVRCEMGMCRAVD